MTVTRLSAGCSVRSPVTVGVWHRMPRRCHSCRMAQARDSRRTCSWSARGRAGSCSPSASRRLGVDAIIVDGKDGPTRESRALAVQARTDGAVRPARARRPRARRAIAGDHRRAGRRPPHVRTGRAAGDGRGRDAVPRAHGLRAEPHRADARRRARRPRARGALGASARAARDRHEDGGARHPSSRPSTTPDGPVTVRARYCVGADGAHSPVREALGVPFEGVTNAHTFYVADAAGVTGLVDGAINIRITRRALPARLPDGPRADAAARRGARPRPRRERGTARGRRARDDAPRVRRRLRGRTGSRPTACTIGSRSGSASARASSSATRRTSTRRSARRA